MLKNEANPINKPENLCKLSKHSL